ncbi:MAG: hypothetical protein DWQ01_01955 [Planctomycetota bacterium]|nr:MAG: hypothetical protein DWQ01_01955 [Planctomycetota bacterium]
MAESLYQDLFRRLEGVRWQLADLPLDQVDPKLVDPWLVEMVRLNCLVEISSLYAVRMFLRDFQHNPDFCQFMSIWYYEEMKHHLAQWEYLKVLGKEPDPGSYGQLETDLKPAPWPATLAMHWIGELRVGMWYHRWAERSREPVLRQLMQWIGNDEFRHAQCYEEFMEKGLEEDPKSLLQYLNAVKYMLVNPGLDKHPTTFSEGSVDGLSVADRIGFDHYRAVLQREITAEDEQRLSRRALKVLSRLSGEDLQSLGDLMRLGRKLENQEAA